VARVLRECGESVAGAIRAYYGFITRLLRECYTQTVTSLVRWATSWGCGAGRMGPTTRVPRRWCPCTSFLPPAACLLPLASCLSTPYVLQPTQYHVASRQHRTEPHPQVQVPHRGAEFPVRVLLSREVGVHAGGRLVRLDLACLSYASRLSHVSLMAL
jgi:hypothetical protein